MRVLIILLAAVSLAANQIPNSSFEFGESMSDILPWIRLRDQALLITKSGWDIDCSTAYDGRRSLKGSGAITFYFESFDQASLKSGWTFSLHMKAEKPEAQVTVDLGFYHNIGRSCHHMKKFRVGGEWQRFDVQIKNIFTAVRRDGLVGPVKVTITPVGDDIIWIDAIQFASGTPSAFRDLVPTIPAEDMPAGQTVPPFDPTSLAEVPRSSGSHEIVISANGEGIRKRVPLSSSVLFCQGTAGRNSSYMLKDGEKVIDADFIPLSVWPQDSSLQSLLVVFSTDVPAEGKRLKLEFMPSSGKEDRGGNIAVINNGIMVADMAGGRKLTIDILSPELWRNISDRKGNTIFGGAELSGFDIAGNKYFVTGMNGIVERNGRLSATMLRRGKLVNERNEAIALFTCRIHVRLDSPALELEFHVVNTAADKVSLIREIYWRASPLSMGSIMDASGVVADRKLRIFTGADIDKRLFTYTRASDIGMNTVEQALPVCLGDDNFRVQVVNAAKTFPAMLAVDRDRAMITAYLWPTSPVRPLSLWPGLSLTRSFILDLEPSTTAQQAETPPCAMPSGTSFSQSGWLNVAVSDPEKFPVFERQQTTSLGGFSPNEMASLFPYGVFDYGDHSGDGGWANLESFEDYCLFIRALRSESAELFRLATAAARHYRDIDTDSRKGLPCTHSVSHINGGHGFGHVWIQGIIADYLLTGSLRSREVAYLVANAVLGLKKNDPEIQDGRNFGFYLLTLAECHAVFNRPEFLRRYQEQLDYQIGKMNHPPDSKAMLMQRTNIPYQDSLFYHKNSGLVPFHCWYGLAGLIRMYDLTGNARLLALIHKEFNNAMNLEMTYRPQLETHWPGLPAEEMLPAIGIDYLLGRGSFFYPVIVRYSTITGNKKWHDLGLDTAYAGLIGGRNSGNPQDVFMAAALKDTHKDFCEEKQLAKIRDLLWRGAGASISNGDFSKTISYRDLVIPKNGIGKPRYPDWALDKAYPRHWHFVEGKQIISSQFMRTRPELYELDYEMFGCQAPSLRLRLNSSRWYLKRQSLTGAKVRIEPGRWDLSMEISFEKNSSPLWFGIVLSDLNDRRGRLLLRYENGAISTEQRDNPDAVCEGIELSPGIKPGWHRMRISFSTDKRQIGTPIVIAGLANGEVESDIRIDDIKLEERIENE